ncbi:MAG: HPr family phosphocarrier protein [Lachnospiraceae bacterium]|nr:HPr family phosphocarrier protein [Lachnospiraceae bacterium]
MSEVLLLLNSVDKVKEFVSIVAKYEEEMDLVSGRKVIDAKSIMGIFCIDLSNPITLRIHGRNENAQEIIDAIGAYVVV